MLSVMASIFTRTGRQPVAALAHTRVQNVTSTATSASAEWESAHPYAKVPGPKPLPIPKFGNFWRFTPFGTFGNISFNNLPGMLFEKYGPVVKLTGLGKPDIVYVRDPEDSEKIFRSEGAWPVRRGIDSMDYYRRVLRKDVFGDFPGVITTQGEEWQKNRSALNPAMMKPQNVKSYHEPFQAIATEFLERMRTLRDSNLELPGNFHNELNKWALESISYAALDTRMGCFDPKGNPESQKLIDYVMEMFDLTFKLDILPSMWKIYETADFKRFITVFDNITNICLNRINIKIKEIQNRSIEDPEGQSILESLLKSTEGEKLAITMAIDMMMAGIDTTSNTVGFVMYHVATNPEVQEKLHQELQRVLPNKTDRLPKNYTNSIPYLKACIKETQRVHPVNFGNFRTSGADLVLKGYQIPKGTDLLVPNMNLGQNEKYFKDAKKFMPERWLKTEEGGIESAKNSHPFAFLPFGFGPRMCIGKRLAELEMHALLAQIFRNFKVSYNYGEMEVKSSILNRPGSPLKFKIEEREN